MKNLEIELDWLRQDHVQKVLMTPAIDDEWFQAYSSKFSENERFNYHAILVPLSLVDESLKTTNWDSDPLECLPNICSYYEDGKETRIYQTYGNQRGIEPLVFERAFHGLQKNFLEISQEFRFFHNLYPGSKDSNFYFFNDVGEKSLAVKSADASIEIRKDLLIKFCAAKQMALVFCVDCVRLGRYSPEELSQARRIENRKDKHFNYDYMFSEHNSLCNKDYKSYSRVIGKKVILPSPFPKDEICKEFHSFITGTDDSGNEVKKKCGPNLGRVDYLRPVFFNREVMNKYYSNPNKYSVRDGSVWCGNLWHLSIDNDHDDHVVVFLGDLGRDLPERERNHWLNFNIPPHGRTLSNSELARSFMAQFCESSSIELVFKRKYLIFNDAFLKKYNWSFFLPLHTDDEHCLHSLFLPENNIYDFEKNIGFLVKLLIDSLNEETIYKFVQAKDKKNNDKGISKLVNFFSELQLNEYEDHITFLRTIQDIRSKMAAHRKGNGYEKLKKELNLDNEEYKQRFKDFLNKSVCFIEYLEEQLLQNKKNITHEMGKETL